MLYGGERRARLRERREEREGKEWRKVNCIYISVILYVYMASEIGRGRRKANEIEIGRREVSEREQRVGER